MGPYQRLKSEDTRLANPLARVLGLENKRSIESLETVAPYYIFLPTILPMTLLEGERWNRGTKISSSLFDRRVHQLLISFFRFFFLFFFFSLFSFAFFVSRIRRGGANVPRGTANNAPPRATVFDLSG